MPITSTHTCKNCRRYGLKMCGRPAGKCAWERRHSPPGERGAQHRSRLSDYGMQLKEKQKARLTYGISEKQFYRYYKEAARRKGVTGSNLIELLETRLDNVVFRLGFARTRRQARQIVNHAHLSVNEIRVDIPSYLIKPGDVVTWRESSKATSIYEAAKANKDTDIPRWIRRETDGMKGRIISKPTVQEKDLGIDTRQIVEFYSRR